MTVFFPLTYSIKLDFLAISLLPLLDKMENNIKAVQMNWAVSTRRRKQTWDAEYFMFILYTAEAWT